MALYFRCTSSSVIHLCVSFCIRKNVLARVGTPRPGSEACAPGKSFYLADVAFDRDSMEIIPSDAFKITRGCRTRTVRSPPPLPTAAPPLSMLRSNVSRYRFTTDV